MYFLQNTSGDSKKLFLGRCTHCIPKQENKNLSNHPLPLRVGSAKSCFLDISYKIKKNIFQTLNRNYLTLKDNNSCSAIYTLAFIREWASNHPTNSTYPTYLPTYHIHKDLPSHNFYIFFLFYCNYLVAPVVSCATIKKVVEYFVQD